MSNEELTIGSLQNYPLISYLMLEKPSSFRLKAFWFLLALSFRQTNALTHTLMDRRTVVASLLSSSVAVPSIANAATGIQGRGGVVARVEGIGGGFDITSSTTIKGKDVIFPASMAGLWKCRRVVTSVEGDTGQAELAFKNLGGTGPIKDIESFQTQFILPKEELGVQNTYEFESLDFPGVVLDRGFEMESRRSCRASWTIENPDLLRYENDGSDVEIVVVQRKVEMPSDKGFGFSELYRITSSAGGIFGVNTVQRAVRVQRRYRRALDEAGNRTVEGREIQKTYRVLDGIAGIEMPTSTTKSTIKLTRN
jgi:hypothetical protein